jgi:hypothetical protein
LEFANMVVGVAQGKEVGMHEIRLGYLRIIGVVV